MDLTGTIINSTYRVKHILSESVMSNVYVGETLKTGLKIAIKTIMRENALFSIDQIIQFQNEYNILSQLNHDNIVKIFETGSIHSDLIPTTYYIVMEYIEGQSLASLIKNRGEIPLEDSVNIIEQICQAIIHIHGSGITHRDLKPSNILIDKNNIVKIIDFGFARMRDFSQFNSLDQVIGTFAYMAPASYDDNSSDYAESNDLYSIGIIFYQMLSGALPFIGDSIMAVIQQHLAATPTPLSTYKKNIPPMIEKIIFKLIDKDINCRYQTAQALLYDIACFKRGRKKFILGLTDKHTHLTYKSHLVGRSNELGALLSLFNKAKRGNGSFCVISGEAGIGKTRLVEEMIKKVNNNSCSFIYGKSRPIENKIPYGPLQESINMYIKSFTHYAESKKNNIVQQLKKELKNHTQILLKFNPNIREITGIPSSANRLTPSSENIIIKTVLSRFLLTLAAQENGMIMLLEDMQWMDNGSLELVGEIVKDISQYPLLLIGTYRSNDPGENPYLRKFVESSRDLSAPVQIMHLAPLKEQETLTFIAGLLLDDSGGNIQIAKLIHDKSNGNPFFTIEVLKQFVEEKTLFYDNGRWNLDYSILCQMKPSKSIIDVILNRVSFLNNLDRNILSCASVLGNNFNMRILYKIGRQIGFTTGNTVTYANEVDIDSCIRNALDLKLVEGNIQNKNILSFAHDRIREALSISISEKEKKRLHLHLAQILEDIHSDDEDYLFEIANHYIESTDSMKILEYAFPAGLKSKEKYANDTALHYLSITTSILEDQNVLSIEHYKKMWLASKEAIGEIYLIIGKYDEAIMLFSEIIQYEKSGIKKSLLNKQICTAYFKKGDWQNTELYGRKGLKMLNEHLPTTNASMYWGIINEVFKICIFTFIPKIFISSGMKHPDRLKLIIHYYMILGWAYGLSNTHKFSYIGLRFKNLLNNGIKNTKEGAMCLGGFGMLLSVLHFFEQAKKRYRKQLAISQAINDDWGMAQSHQWMGFCCQWQGNYRTSIMHFKKSLELFKNIQDLREIAISNLGLFENYFYISDYENMERANEEYYMEIQDSGDKYGISSSWHYKTLLYLERGDLDTAEKLAFKNYNFSFVENLQYRHYLAAIQLGLIFFEKNDIDKSLEYLLQAKELKKFSHFISHYIVQHEIYLAEALIVKYNNCDIDNTVKKKYLSMAKNNISRALKTTKNWPVYRGSAFRVTAMYYDMKNRKRMAGALFKKGISFCKKNGRKYELAKCYLHYGYFLKKHGQLNSAINAFELAYILFNSIGSHHYKRILEKILNIRVPDGSAKGDYIRQQRLDFIINIHKGVETTNAIEDYLMFTLSGILTLVSAQRGYVFLYNKSKKILDLKVYKTITGGGSTGYSKNIINSVFESGKPVLTMDAETDETFDQYNSVVSNRLKSIICVPITIDKRNVGVLYIDNPLAKGVFCEDDIGFLQLLLSHVITVMQGKNSFGDLWGSGIRHLEITDATKSKLDQIVKYLEENYSSEISREALAYSVGMSPNYMSKLFNEYTGKKISIFINELRIKDAEHKLSATEENIIDIAYSVGFESLRTFNRVFLHLKGLTPKEYREIFKFPENEL